MKQVKSSVFIAFTDVTWAVLIAVLGLWILTLFLINPPTKNDGDIKPRADFLITLEWEDQSTSDIDLWMKGPNNELISFGNKSQNGIFLDRDDLGIDSDAVTLKDGTVKYVRINQETITIRGFQPGEYVFNAHFYRGDKPEKLKVTVIKLEPYKILYSNSEIVIDVVGQEKTLISFNIQNDGYVHGISERQINFVNKTIAAPQNGSSK